MASDKIPAMQFYPGDWRKDPGVQALDFETRGIWFEILCIMWESEDRGKLTLNGKPMPDEALAKLLGMELAKTQQALSKLISYGVATREQTSGSVVNRRMLRDETLRQARARGGRLGGLAKAGKSPGKAVAVSTPSSSSSSSSSSSDKNKKEKSAELKLAVAPDPDLKDLELYAVDLKLNAAWPKFKITSAQAYPGVNLMAEVRKAHKWEVDNPKHRKINRPRFLNNWLSKAQDEIGRVRSFPGQGGSFRPPPSGRQNPPQRAPGSVTPSDEIRRLEDERVAKADRHLLTMPVEKRLEWEREIAAEADKIKFLAVGQAREGFMKSGMRLRAMKALGIAEERMGVAK